MDIAHYYSGDLQVAANGDLLAVDSVIESQQRILRRLLTNPNDYIWNPAYGAGLPSRIGSTTDQAEMNALITSQMFKEESVVQNPAPQVSTSQIPNGLGVHIQYVESDSNSSTILSFEVNP